MHLFFTFVISYGRVFPFTPPGGAGCKNRPLEVIRFRASLTTLYILYEKLRLLYNYKSNFHPTDLIHYGRVIMSRFGDYRRRFKTHDNRQAERYVQKEESENYTKFTGSKAELVER